VNVTTSNILSKIEPIRSNGFIRPISMERKIILIGSRAAHCHYPNAWKRWNDYDLILKFEDFKSFIEEENIPTVPIGKNKFAGEWNGSMIEFEIAWPGSSAYDVFDIIEGRYKKIEGVTMFIPSMDWLFAFKASHKYKKNCPHFEKTMHDYHAMKMMGCKIPNLKWFKKREKETYVKKRPRLNTTKEDFFHDSELKYVYDHDTLHIAVAHLAKPAYEYYKADNEEVFCSKAKWDICNEQIKLYGVLEESYVLALERSQIPYRDTISPFESFKIALMKVCTSITSGWFREYAYENYYKILQMYSDEYVEKFKEGLKNGIVKKVEEK